MNDQVKEDVIYAVSTVAQAVETVEARLEDLRNDVIRIDNGIAGPNGIISYLHHVNNNLTVIKWLLVSLLMAAIIALLR